MTNVDVLGRDKSYLKRKADFQNKTKTFYENYISTLQSTTTVFKMAQTSGLHPYHHCSSFSVYNRDW